MVIGRSKAQTFNFIKERMEKKIGCWKKNKLLSQAGKEVMVKSVALALPVYCMSCFKLPKGICNAVNKEVAAYWWGQKEKERKIHWVAWKKMTKLKDQGGLGLKDLQAFNEALLAKVLISRILKARYYPRTSFLKQK